MARVIFLFLALLVGAGAVFGSSSEVTATSEPCQTHACPQGKVCKTIVSEKLVPFPVAVCVRNVSAKEGPCRQLAVASNLLNCKTKDEWERAAIIQCSVREEGMVLHEAKVQHVCYSATGPTYYLRVEITCCSVAMPTSASDSSELSNEKISSDDAHSQNDPNTNDHNDAEPATDPSTATNDMLTGTPAYPESSPAHSPHVEPIAYYLPVVLGLIALLLIVLLVIFMVWRRLAPERRLRKKVQTPRTVYINPEFGDYQVMFYSNKGKF